MLRKSKPLRTRGWTPVFQQEHAPTQEEGERKPIRSTGVDSRIECPIMVSKEYTEIERFIAEADIVLGVFPDQVSPEGIGHIIIKGVALLHRTSEAGVMATFQQLTIPCDDRAEADAYRSVFGDAKAGQ